MKALILNSGTGSRMGALTANTNKCMVDFGGVNIFHLQLKFLQTCGINEIVVTTGPFADSLQQYAEENFPNLNFTFVNNKDFSSTNYIYSIYLARDVLQDDDFLLMHGDLIFEQNVLQDVIDTPKSVMCVDKTRPLPPKDFKAKIENNRITTVSIDTFESSFYAQPLYKFLQKDWKMWLNNIINFCENQNTKVYAENALNPILNKLALFPLELYGRECFEVDNLEDLEYAKNFAKNYLQSSQKIFSGKNAFERGILTVSRNFERPFVVCDEWARPLIESKIDNGIYFTDFTPNPTVEQVWAGIEKFQASNCDFIISFGGGSAVDVAKCVNILENNGTSLSENTRAKHLAIPTTAGTGAESTKFAVVYQDGEKLSIESKKILPEFVILHADFLSSLPLYHKKSALLDAISQAIESLWAKGKTAQSKSYALSAMNTIFDNAKGYIEGDLLATKRILSAANLAGKAINIGKTTAPHALSYKLSSMFGVAHGHAVALCLPALFQDLASANALPVDLNLGILEKYIELVKSFDLKFSPQIENLDEMVETLANSVNIQRLNNHPQEISHERIREIYREILSE